MCAVRLPQVGANGRMDGGPATAHQEDDVTDPGTATDADRAEQEARLDPPAVTSTAEAAAPAADVPEADALEQQLAARPGESGGLLRPVGDRDGSEADILEQDAAVPVDDDDVLT
jgi:hypothetical protein